MNNKVTNTLFPGEEDPSIDVIIEDKDDVSDRFADPFTVILYNDEIHSTEEVHNQIKKATGFGDQKAYAIMMEAHESGKAAVVQGDMPKCLRVTGILNEIGLHTEIEG